MFSKSFLGKILNYWEIGQSKIFSRFNSVINFGLLLMTWLAVQGFRFPSWFILFLVLGMGFGLFFSGFVYVRLGMYDVEAKRYNSIDPFKKEVLDRLGKIEELLK